MAGHQWSVTALSSTPSLAAVAVIVQGARPLCIWQQLTVESVTLLLDAVCSCANVHARQFFFLDYLHLNTVSHSGRCFD